ncbi:MFS transporter [Blastococcus sp. TF02A-30]|uniref:MFS transporter n=1 Tax=Blastococcus sp. TF02A-30 TaxID=2250580 RepID=UPI000DE9CC49|nr:MFS transporter [Blastococcus sp. TF02A-30]RBY89378.1 MFS transporter [Blastococcus sp. TF02A-30]
MTATVAPRAVERAKVAVGAAFTINGLAIASWISRVPAARDQLGSSSSRLGLLLLCASLGSVLALPASGAVVHRLGPARSAFCGGSVSVTGMLVLAAGLTAGGAPLAALGLFLLGAGIAFWDVSMNVEGADVEHRLGRAVMPRFHAGFSLGTVAGGLGGAAAAALEVSLAAQLVVTAVLVLAALAVATRSFLPVEEAPDQTAGSRSGASRAWREPRTLLLGLLVLTFAFTEGTAYDWLAVGLTDGYGAGEVLAATGFAIFVAAMTAVRIVGTTLLDRYGRVPVLRAGAVAALAGVVLFVLSPSAPVALAGAVLWGAGAALGFPVGMSAAADEPARAAARVSVVSSIGYTAFLAGPPLIGFLADATGILRAMLVVLVALAVGAPAVGAVRPAVAQGRVAA